MIFFRYAGGRNAEELLLVLVGNSMDAIGMCKK